MNKPRIQNLIEYQDFFTKEILNDESKQLVMNQPAQSNGNRLSVDAKTICGNKASALGWAPLCFGVCKEDDYIRNIFSYDRFCRNVFNLSVFNPSLVFYWFFSPNWYNRDNSKLGFIKRIDWFLEHGVPSRFSFFRQIRGREKLCYDVEPNPRVRLKPISPEHKYESADAEHLCEQPGPAA